MGTPKALPVLPARVNRNVEQFLNLYGTELPFVRRSDLRRGAPVESVTVVDTQSFSTARGMRPETPVHFIDHHPLSRDLEANYTFTGDPVGAATTLLVEQIHAQQISIVPLQATLLLLGLGLSLMVALALRFAKVDAADLRRAAHATLSALSLIALALFLITS